MTQLQLIYDRQAQTRQEIKEIKAMAAEALENHPKYQDALAELNAAKSKADTLKAEILEGYQKDLDKLDTLKADADNDRQLMTDQALSQFVKGEEVVVTHKGVEYVAEFSVRFKKK
jgi:hypothetical protein